jgi:ribosome-binding protein aMBF1 (putative translation factor)
MEQEQETRTCKRCGRELPISEFKTHKVYGHTHVCKECNKAAYGKNKDKAKEIAELKKAIEDARQASLENFSPRELMAELYRRGYEGELLPPRIPINIKNM